MGWDRGVRGRGGIGFSRVCKVGKGKENCWAWGLGTGEDSGVLALWGREGDL